MTFLLLPGLSSAQGLSGQDVGARPSSEGHGQRDSQTPLLDKGWPTILHRSPDETEQDEMRHVTLRLPDPGSLNVCRLRWNGILLHTEEWPMGIRGDGHCVCASDEILRKYSELWRGCAGVFLFFLCESLNLGEFIPLIIEAIRQCVCVCVCLYTCMSVNVLPTLSWREHKSHNLLVEWFLAHFIFWF